MAFKVHIGWTQLATLVAVETRLTHGQVVEKRVSGSLRSYRGLSRFMELTVQFDRPDENVSCKGGKNMFVYRYSSHKKSRPQAINKYLPFVLRNMALPFLF